MARKRKSRLYAFELGAQADMSIEPAPGHREWMDQSPDRYAYRCLPLVIANQSGWVIRNPVSFSLRWNGGDGLDDLKIKIPRGIPELRIQSHFGLGIVTFTLPYLFRTPPEINLWVKGPANWIKDGIQPLEGVVETDWSDATFTMNWKVTRRNHTIRFEQNEPICMIVPVPRGLVEELEPIREPVNADPDQFERYKQWRESRQLFNDNLQRQEPAVVARGWQRDYLLGTDSDGQPFEQHQTKLRVRPFQRPK